MSYVTWYNEIYIESTCLLFCFDGWALTLLVLHADFYTSENVIVVKYAFLYARLETGLIQGST